MHISLIVLWDASCFELRTTFNSVEIELWLKIIPFFPSFLPPLYHVNFQSILVSLGRLFGRNCRPKTQKRHGVFETLDAISGSKLFHAQLKWFATIRSQKPPLFSLYQLTFLSLSLLSLPSHEPASTLHFLRDYGKCMCIDSNLSPSPSFSIAHLSRSLIKIPKYKSVKKREKKRRKNRTVYIRKWSGCSPVHVLYTWNRVILRFILRFIPARFPCPCNLSVFAFVENHNVSTADISAK